jgi:hypothetical protein
MGRIPLSRPPIDISPGCGGGLTQKIPRQQGVGKREELGESAPLLFRGQRQRLAGEALQDQIQLLRAPAATP